MVRSIQEQIGERRLTPMLEQYVEAKAAAPDDAILLFRMGDFYELFFDDARLAARELDISLTARDKDKTDPIPMAGVPHHAITGYIARLVQRGYTVAICDQVEDPKAAKGIVKRDITRLVTPGTVSDLEALDPGAANFIACVEAAADNAVVALLDMLAGELLVAEIDPSHLGDELSRMGAREVIYSQSAAHLASSLDSGDGMALRRLDEELFDDEKTAAESLSERFGTSVIDGWPIDAPQAAAEVATFRLLRYAESTQRRRLKHIVPPRLYRTRDFLHLDAATRRNLELLRTQIDGKRQGSLIWHLDRCKTAMGSRMLSQWMLFPLRTEAAIEDRLDAVSGFVDDFALALELRETLAEVRDIERLLGKMAVGRAQPRDIGLLRDSLVRLPQIAKALKTSASPLAARWGKADLAKGLCKTLTQALVDDPPVHARDGGVFRMGYRDDLDEVISLSTQSHGFLSALEARERERTGIAKLKVRYNKVFGYYIEVSKANQHLVPKDYVRKQTLVNAERFITDELKEFEVKVLGADERRRELELELFDTLVQNALKKTAVLRHLARLVSELDALVALAVVAKEHNYCRPQLSDAPILELKAARHPVVERLMPGGERFVPNDVSLDARSRQVLLVTGPNMAGKSTVMRQVALCSLLAHMGSFVPAQAATVGLSDRLFTRVGASDNLGRGFSTFMVEMTETATILAQATDKSLVILDEIGRGTSTYDGVSIAWAVAEYIHDNVGCRTMFATHYHELTHLSVERPRIQNVSVAVQEEGGKIVFLRHLVEGAANRSYGIQVAALAGLPDSVVQRAEGILDGLQTGESVGPKKQSGFGQMNLFTASSSVMQPAARGKNGSHGGLPKYAKEVVAALAEIDPMATTPLEALNTLDRLKRLTTEG